MRGPRCCCSAEHAEDDKWHRVSERAVGAENISVAAGLANAPFLSGFDARAVLRKIEGDDYP